MKGCNIAIALTFPLQGERYRLVLCAGLNRYEAEEEESSRERSSDPLGLESCASPIAR